MASRFSCYERLLRLYPKGYRERYADQMVQTLSDMLDDQPTTAGKMLVWLRASVDLPAAIIRQNALMTGDILMHQMPTHIKQSGLLAALLLLPFVAILAADSLNEILFNHTLYHSWLWSTPVLTAWVLILPVIALVVALASYIVFTVHSGKKERSKRLLDVKRTWPVVITGLIGLGILFGVLFHDSVHCFVQQPQYLATHEQQIWQCALSNSFFGN